MGGRKKYRKFGIFLILALISAFMFPVSSLGASEGFLEGYEAGEGKLRVYSRALKTESETPSPQQFTVTLSGESLSVAEVSTVHAAEIPITFYCLVDVSGSMGPEQIAQAREVLLSVCGGLREHDNMVIGSLGNDLAASGFLTDKDEIKNAVNALQAGKEDTNLYAGIVKGLEVLKTDSRVNEKKCLLILSDGEDDQKSGITQTEAEQAVKNSSIPVYTVAALPREPEESQLEFAKVLGSFARLSVGGVHYAPVVDGVELAAVGDHIWRSENQTLVLTADISGIQAEKDVLLMRVVYADGEQTVEDTMEILSEDLKAGSATDQESSSSLIPAGKFVLVPILTPVLPGLSKQQPGNVWETAAIICAVFLVLALGGAVFVLKRKKGKQAEEGTGEGEVIDEGGEEGQHTGSESRQGTAGQEPSLRPVRFTAIGYEQICFILELPEDQVVTLGRDNRSDFVLNSQDRRLSGIHCKIRCGEHMLTVWDMSRNGTFVNGVLVKQMGMAVIEDGQSVRMGSYEYRVSIARKNIHGTEVSYEFCD